MGVIHLESFLKKHPACCWTVNIKQLAEGYRSETGKEPILLVDGTNCFYTLYDFSRGDWLVGGQLLFFRKTLERFVNCFKVDPPTDLEEWEVSAYISQAVLMGSMTMELLSKISSVSIPDCRIVHLSSLIGRGVTTVQLLLAACGLPLEQGMPWNYFDGVLFHRQYLLAKQQEDLLLEMADQKEEFNLVKQIVYLSNSSTQADEI